MSRPQPPPPAKLFVSLLTADRSLLVPVAARLSDAFGPLDISGSWWPFDYTTYYQEELGQPLERRMLSFKPLVDQGALAKIKLRTNALEAHYSRQGRRRINLDPGLVTAERVVLATGKNFTHRIYIGDNIYGDLTLIFTRGNYQPLPWTYPDYTAEKMLAYLKRVRDKYGRDLKADPSATGESSR